jgi:hypothetical protein
MIPDIDDGYFTKRYLCERYQRSGRTIERWMTNPATGFPHYAIRVRRTLLWTRQEVIAWEREHPDVSVTETDRYARHLRRRGRKLVRTP